MCECVIGKSECIEARILHEITNARYRVWQSESTEDRWNDYEAAQTEYRRHLDGAESCAQISFSVQTERRNKSW